MENSDLLKLIRMRKKRNAEFRVGQKKEQLFFCFQHLMMALDFLSYTCDQRGDLENIAGPWALLINREETC